MDIIKNREPIRIAQVMGKMSGGGVEAVVMNYYRHIDHDKVQFDLIVDADSTHVPAKLVEAFGGRIIEIPPYQHQPDNIRALDSLFCHMGWRIVHSHMNSLSVLPLRSAYRAKIPIRIAHSHSTWGKGEWKRNILKAALRTQSNRYPNYRAACTQHAGEWLFGKDVPITIIPNAFETDAYAFSESQRQALRKEIGATEETFIIGHVGRFCPQKNQSFLIDVILELKKVIPNSLLVFVGDGQQQSEVKSLAASKAVLPYVRFLGQRSDMPALYSAMDVFCLPSIYEGFGNVIVEALRSGLPCLTFDCVPQEVCVTGGITRFTRTSRPAEWATFIQKLHGKCRRGISENEKKNFLQLDISVQAPKMTAYYERLFSSQP